LADNVSNDLFDWIEQIPACVVFQGVIRPAFVEEIYPIQKLLSADESRTTEISEVTENLGAINGQKQNTKSSENKASQQVEINGNSDTPLDETSFYIW
jgi:hypothetical protein